MTDAGSNLDVIDGATNTLTGSIAVGTGPSSIAVNPSTGHVVVANYNSGSGNTISVIDEPTSRVIGTVAFPTDTYAVGVNPNSNQVYVSSYDGNTAFSTMDSLATTYTYNAANELTAIDGQALSYDANGNLTGVQNGNTFTYNAKNQTASITPAGGSAIPMTYTGASQTERTAAGSVDAAYGALGLSSTTSSGASTYFTRGPDGTLISERTPTGTYYYLFDGQGSVVGLTDASGNLVNRYSYDPYGAIVSSSESVPNPWRIAGAYLDAATGLYKIGARYYDPTVGRWTQWDPVLFLLDPRGWNPYAFVGDDPVNYVDPCGMDPAYEGGDGLDLNGLWYLAGEPDTGGDWAGVYWTGGGDGEGATNTASAAPTYSEPAAAGNPYGPAVGAAVHDVEYVSEMFTFTFSLATMLIAPNPISAMGLMVSTTSLLVTCSPRCWA